MFLRFFRSSFFSQYLAIIIAGLLLWSRAFFIPPLMPAAAGPVPFYKLLFLLLSEYPLIAVILGFLLNIGSAFFLNWILTKHEILPKNSSLAAFLYIFLVSYHPVFLTLHPVNICLFILLFVLEKLFDSYSREDPLELAYSAGFLIAAGALFYFPFLFFYAFVLIAFIAFRTLSPREWIGSFIGLVTPFIFLIVYYFWFDLVPVRLHEFLRSFIPGIDMTPLKSPGFMVFTIILAVLLLFGIFAGMSRISEKTIEIRRKTLLLVWLVVVVIPGFFFAGPLVTYQLLISFITVSALLSIYILRLKETFWQEVVLGLLILFVLIHNLFRFFT
jgi:hypothetical protein